MSLPAGSRPLAVASASMAIVAAIHTIGNVVPPAELAERLAPLRQHMESTVLPLGLGMMPSVWAVLRSLVFTMSVGLLAIGCLGMAVALDHDASSGLRRRVAGVATMACGALATIYWWYGIAPPLLMMGMATLSFAYAWRQRP